MKGRRGSWCGLCASVGFALIQFLLVSNLQSWTVVPDAVDQVPVGARAQKYSPTAEDVLELPNWRLATDCSVYSRDCFLANLGRKTYAPYPFQIGREFDHLYQWQPTLPKGWRESLETNRPCSRSRFDIRNEPRVDRCVQAARLQSVDQQLDGLLLRLDRTLGMVSFTISDYGYAKDMLHDVFEMAHDVVGFEHSFFMVAIENSTVELACYHNFPFVAWPETSGGATHASLKSAVTNTKFDISYALLQRNQSFFFFEMDVWFVRSPLPFISKQTADIVFSSHQDNPGIINIGVYSVHATTPARDFFAMTIDLMRQSPETHDQMVMQQITWWLEDIRQGVQFDRLEYHGWWNAHQPLIPNVTSLEVVIDIFSPHQISSSVWPAPTEATLAIHTLSRVPLQNPNGKKLVAKELGAWHGTDGYYDSSESRYLWFDGHVWSGYSSSMIWPGYTRKSYTDTYHNLPILQWTVAALIALARRTNRIWVLPKLLNDKGVYFLWVSLDMKTVEDLVEVRETNFPTNRKAWKNDSVPFHPVARTALAADGRMFMQGQADASSTEGVVAWRLGPGEIDLDAWFAIHTTIDELADAQVLLAGMPLAAEYLNRLREKVRSQSELSIAEEETHDVHQRLRWCQENFLSYDMTVATTEPAWDCYGRGSRPWLL